MTALSSVLRSPRDAWLVMRMTAWAVAFPFLKRVVPLPRLVRLAAARRRLARDSGRIEQLSRLLYASRLSKFDNNCLDRSLVTYRYLGEAGAEPELHVAFSADGQVVGHVWVTVDGRPIHDQPSELARYVPLLRFDARGTRLPVQT